MTLFKLLSISRFPYTVLWLAGLLMIFAQPVTANEFPTLPDDSTENEITADFVGWCPSNANICRVNRDWTVEAIQAQLGSDRWKVWQEGNQLIFAIRTRAQDVLIAGGISTNLTPVKDSDYWVATLQILNIDHAMVSYIFGVMQNGTTQLIADSHGVWRGQHAPKPPPMTQPTRLITQAIYSPELDEMRQVSVYLPLNYSGVDVPVVYMADGQALAAFTRVMEPLIYKGLIPPTMIVGVHAPWFEPTRNRRSEEYVLGLNDDVYIAHEQFFTKTVRRWAELQFGASQDPAKRAIFGFSDGAVFAGNTGVRHPNLYGQVMMFSTTQQPYVTLRTAIEPRYYLLAGTLEPPIYAQTHQFYFSLLLLNAEARFTRRIAGHDGVMWQEEFVSALRWMFLPDN